ncbi:MAG: Translation initiation factor 2, partial [Myxococcaceae bacterium]|nr:Translation initiation factor 2 [Myxococcaceae bacterium]
PGEKVRPHLGALIHGDCGELFCKRCSGLGESSMSIFSRLFNKGQDPEAKPADQASTGQAGQPGAHDPSQAAPGSAPGDEEVLGTFAEDDDDIDDPTKQQERPDLVFETARPDTKAKKTAASKAVPPPPPPPDTREPPRAPDDTSTLVRQTASTGTPPRGGPMPAPPVKSSQASGPRSHAQPSSPPPLPKKDGARTDAKSPATPPALPVQPGAPSNANAHAQTPPQPQTGPKGGRPVADLGKLFDGGDGVETLERALVDEETSNALRPQTRTETSDIRNLFIEMAGNYVLPVRDFMFDVKSGDARVDWLHTCESSVRSLREAADSLAMGKLAHALEKFGEVLKSADASQGQEVHGETRGQGEIRGEMRDQLLAAYFNLIDLMPQAFGLDAERSRRETIIINSLLLQIPGVQRNTVDLMHAAGLTTLETIVGAKSEEVAAATGLSMEVATKIVDKLQAHRKELEAGSLAGLPPTPAPEGFGAPPMPGTRGHRTASPSMFDSVEAPSIEAIESSIDIVLDDGQAEVPTSLHAAVKLLPPSSDRDLIDALVAELKAQQAEFASVSEGWTEAATSRRRELRKLRADALQKVKVVLIRLGEAEGVSEIEKLSFEQKLERIERYLRA